MKIEFVHVILLSVFLVVNLSVRVYGTSVWNELSSHASPLLAETPKVILQYGTAGTSTIYTNNTGAKISVAAPIWLTGWDKRLRITIDHNDVDSGLSNFSVLVYLGNSSGRNNDDVSLVFDEVGSNSKKIAVTTSDRTTQCYVEIERWDNATEQAWLWVKVPSISNTTDTDLYLYYDVDHGDNTDYVGDTGSTPARNVWDGNYVAVWHLKEDPSTGSEPRMKDSASNPADMTTHGTMTSSDLIDAKVDGGIDFDGTDDYFEADAAKLDLTGTEVTLEGWVRVPASGVNNDEAIIIKATSTDAERYMLGVEDSAGGTDLLNGRITNSGGTHYRFDVAGVPTGAWTYIAVRYDGTRLKGYVDGELLSGADIAASGNIGTASSDVLRSGRRLDNRWYEGDVDELRVSDVARSEAWIKASYESGRDDLVDFASGGSTCSFYSGWNYRKKITIDHTKVEGSTDFTNFPVLISLPSDAGLANHARDNGWDILFTSSDGKTKLSHEIEKFDGNTGELVAWVKAPTLYATSGTVLYVYYGNPSATNQENVTNVWSNGYVAVWHLNDDFEDSTSNNHDGTNYGSTDVAGNMARGREFNPDDGSADRIEFGTWSVSGSQITIQTWAKFDDFNQDDPRVVTKAQSGAEQDHVFMLSLTNGGSGDNRMRMRLKTGTSDSSGTTTLIAGSSGDMTANTWYLLATTYDGSYMRLMKNGDVVGSTTKNGDLRENSWEIWAGNNPGGSTTMFSMDGKLDEIRISNVTRSTAWLKTEYNNQYNPSNFYSMGSEEESTSTTYDYVLEVVNQVADNWQVNLQVYDSSNIGRLSSLNISLHDGTSSNQIAVSGGNITQPEGPPYNLTSNMTIYISISALQATSSGTSYLYVYLKILVPSTSTYNLFIITLEIT